MKFIDFTAHVDRHRFECVFGNVDAATRREVARLWVALGAIPDHQRAMHRTNQLAWVARDEGGTIRAVSTLFRGELPSVDGVFWQMRTLTEPGSRRNGLAKHMGTLCRLSLARGHEPDDPEAGLGAITENEGLRSDHGRRTISARGWVHRGFTDRGHDIWTVPWEAMEVPLPDGMELTEPT